MSNIHGFSSLHNSNKNKDKNNEELSVGGKTSSTAVLRPNNAADIVKQAHEQKDKIGNLAEDKNLGLITLYSNGFIIGSNGEFRETVHNLRNQQFLAHIKKQEVPEELEAICVKEWGQDVDTVRIHLIDKSSETYILPKAKFDFTQSKGQSTNNNDKDESKSVFYRARPQKLELNPNYPSITIQIQLADRKKLKETFNEDVTIMHLYSHIMYLSNRNKPDFELLTGYPPKPLTKLDQSILEAGLTGAQVIQK